VLPFFSALIWALFCLPGLVWVPFFAVWSPLVGPKTGGEKRRFFPGPPGLLFGLFRA